MEKLLPNRMLSMKDVMEILGYSRRHIHRLLGMKQFPTPTRLGTGRKPRLKWKPSEIEKWMAARERKSAASA